MEGSREPTPELIAVATSLLSTGRTLDEAASAVLRCNPNPITAIKTLRIASPGLSLAEAKPLVDRNLAPDVLKATEALRDQVEKALNDIAAHDTTTASVRE